MRVGVRARVHLRPVSDAQELDVGQIVEVVGRVVLEVRLARGRSRGTG